MQWPLGKGAFTVSADGKVSGDFVFTQPYSPPAGSYALRLRGFRLRFISAGRVEGAYANSQVIYPAGVYGWRLAGPVLNITMEKQ